MDVSKNHAALTHASVRTLVINAFFIAMVLVATAFMNVRLPIPPIAGNGGMFHLGNAPLFIAAILFGRRTGALAGAFGMGLFDLLSGSLLWAPFTFVIAGLMGYAVGAIAGRKNGDSFSYNLLAVAAACVIKIVGYYIADGIIYGNWWTPLGSIPGHLLQVVLAAVIVLPLIKVLRKVLPGL